MNPKNHETAPHRQVELQTELLSATELECALQVIGQRKLASRGKVISQLDHADFAPRVVIFHTDKSAPFALFDRHRWNHGNTHACGNHGEDSRELAALKNDAWMQIGLTASRDRVFPEAVPLP